MLISIIIPTLNSGDTLSHCLESVRQQHLGGHTIEIVIADGGSEDDTLQIAARFGVDKVVPNPLRTGEAGKSAAIAASRGDLIALIDSDNILSDTRWIQRMIAPFRDEQIIGSEPLHYSWRRRDPALTRYFALLGMNDPLCLFLGNYDRLSQITGRWTGQPVEQTDCGDYLRVTLDPDGALPTIGANGFVFRRSLLDQVAWQPYFFDIDIVQQAVAAGHRQIAKVKCGIVHLYCQTLEQFARKQRRRIRDFLHFRVAQQRSYPWHRQSRGGVVRFVLSTLLVLPLLVQMLRGAARRRDAAWWYHVPVCWVTLAIYGYAVAAQLLGVKPRELDRGTWQRPRARNR